MSTVVVKFRKQKKCNTWSLALVCRWSMLIIRDLKLMLTWVGLKSRSLLHCQFSLRWHPLRGHCVILPELTFSLFRVAEWLDLTAAHRAVLLSWGKFNTHSVCNSWLHTGLDINFLSICGCVWHVLLKCPGPLSTILLDIYPIEMVDKVKISYYSSAILYGLQGIILFLDFWRWWGFFVKFQVFSCTQSTFTILI